MSSLSRCPHLRMGFHCTSLHAGDPRRPYPQDIEMRSGFLGGFVPSAAPPADQGKFGTNLTSLEPPEKKIALDKGGTIVLQGNCHKVRVSSSRCFTCILFEIWSRWYTHSQKKTKKAGNPTEPVYL